MKILGWIIAIPFILLALFALARFLFCGPDKDVEKVAFPLAKAIVEHIEAKGIPEKLTDVEGLPYELIGCKKEIEEYTQTSLQGTRIISISSIEKCYFVKSEKQYTVSTDFTNIIHNKNIDIDIDITHKHTVARYRVRYKSKNNKWIHISYPKTKPMLMGATGFCKPQPLRFVH